MAHDHMKHFVADETAGATGRIVASLLGGVLLLAALIAKLVFVQPFHSGLLAFIAAILLGAPLVGRAIQDLWAGRTEMNELVALGVVAAFSAGEYLTAGAISFFMILSAMIETRTAMGARKTIASLIHITPQRACKVVDGVEMETDARNLRPGDMVRVRPGDSIPGDGIILSGFSSIDQANITGESLPVDRTEGDEVFGGTINLTGAIEVRITKAGADTTLGRVQELVLQAEQTRTPAMRLADRYAHWYTPVVLMVAVIVLVFTRDMQRVISLLVVSCPCAIILATPTAMVAALSAAARLGVLVKNVSDLERARNLTAMVFDKTGTLTTGQLSVTRLGPAADVDPADLLSAAASVEQHSNHPAARAVMQVAARAQVATPAVDEFEEVPGRGVLGTVNGQRVCVGRQSWLAEQGVGMDGPGQQPPEGLSLLHVAAGGRLLGWIGFEDRVRPDTASAMQELHGLGMRQLVMVTGDRQSVARRITAELPFTDVQAELLPAQKLDVVARLKALGHSVAVVGDGVNDAPALAAGDLSIAMGAAGSDVAIHSASVALMNNNLNRIPFLIRLSRATARVILQGLVFGVLYIVVFGTLSAFGKIHPVVAAVLHAGASIIVVFNSARLVREGEDITTAAPEPRMEARALAASASAPAAATA